MDQWSRWGWIKHHNKQIQPSSTNRSSTWQPKSHRWYSCHVTQKVNPYLLYSFGQRIFSFKNLHINLIIYLLYIESKSYVLSVKWKESATSKCLASCTTTGRTASDFGATEVGRWGRQSGRCNSLSSGGQKKDITDRQNMNL